MSSLLESLQAIDPNIDANSAADVRSCLVALAVELQGGEEQDSRLEGSLNAWWQWLDDEGYNRESFGAVMRQVTASCLGAELGDLLIETVQAHADEENGLPGLIALISNEHAALSQMLSSLEALAVEEQQRLDNTAGGMGAGAIAGIALGSLATVCIGGYVAKKGPKQVWNSITTKYNNLKTYISGHRRAAAERLEGAATQEASNLHLQAESLIHAAEAHPDQVIKDYNLEIAAFMKSGENPRVFFKGELLHASDLEIEHLSWRCAEKHMEKFAYDNSLMNNLAKVYKNSSEYKREVTRIQRAWHDDNLAPTEQEVKQYLDKTGFTNQGVDKIFSEYKAYGPSLDMDGMIREAKQLTFDEIANEYKSVLLAEKQLVKAEFDKTLNAEIVANMPKGKRWVHDGAVRIENSVFDDLQVFKKIETDITLEEKKLEREIAGLF